MRAARLLQERAEKGGDPLSNEEQKQVDAALEKGRRPSDQLAAQRHDAEVWQMAKDLSDEVGLPPIGSGGALSSTIKGRRLSFKGMGEAAARKVVGHDVDGQKALAAGGSVIVEQSFQGDPIALGQPATTILDVLPVRVQPSPQYAYLRQSVRANAAAVVAEGAVKPTSTYTLVRVADQLDVMAHLSEGVPRFWLTDTVALQQFLDNELRYGLEVAVEAMIVSDVSGTSGIQPQVFATSVLATLRKSLTRLEIQGYSPSSVWVNPVDFEAIELALSTVTAVEYQGLPYDAAARRLWGVPLVISNAVTAGGGFAVASGAVELNTDS